MIATIINMALVLLGSIIGLLFKNKISPRFSAAIFSGLALCVMGIGISSTLKTNDTLCVIICMVIGTVIGEAIQIEARMDGAGEFLRKKLIRGENNSRFVEGFVASTILFCVGAMAINGSLEAGLNQDYSIIISKGVIDGVTAITFAAAMGVGVAFSALPILIYQGALTLLAQYVGPYLGADVIAEMSAIGGTLIVGIAINMLGMTKEKIRVGNMLPAIFLPIVYIPVVNLISRLVG